MTDRTEIVNEDSGEMPEDVRRLAAWANMPGLRYHDFSGIRREYRTRVRASREVEGGVAPAWVSFATEAMERRRPVSVVAVENAPIIGEPLGSEDAKPEMMSVPGDMSDPYEPEGLRGAADDGAYVDPEVQDDHVAEPMHMEPEGSGDWAAGNVLRQPEATWDVPSSETSLEPARSKGVAASDGNSEPALIASVPMSVTARKLEIFEGAPADETYGDLDGVVEPERTGPLPALAHTSAEERRAARKTGPIEVPVVAVFSLAGGTGKSSLVATLGRALSSLGEEVELVETAAEGMLPYFFGTSDLRPGVVRSFAPPPGSAHAAVHLLGYDVGSSSDGHDALLDSIVEPAPGAKRVLVDLNGPLGSVLRQLARRAATVRGLTILVPVAPDLSSVLRLHAMERYLNGVVAGDGEWVLPYYVLNRYDETSTFHAEIRQMLAGQLGERLLPFPIRYDTGVSEAFGQKMTVIDLRPRRPVADDFLELATWLAEKVPAVSEVPISSRTRWWQ